MFVAFTKNSTHRNQDMLTPTYKYKSLQIEQIIVKKFKMQLLDTAKKLVNETHSKFGVL